MARERICAPSPKWVVMVVKRKACIALSARSSLGLRTRQAIVVHFIACNSLYVLLTRVVTWYQQFQKKERQVNKDTVKWEKQKKKRIGVVTGYAIKIRVFCFFIRRLFEEQEALSWVCALMKIYMYASMCA